MRGSHSSLILLSGANKHGWDGCSAAQSFYFLAISILFFIGDIGTWGTMSVKSKAIERICHLQLNWTRGGSLPSRCLHHQLLHGTGGMAGIAIAHMAGEDPETVTRYVLVPKQFCVTCMCRSVVISWVIWTYLDSQLPVIQVNLTKPLPGWHPTISPHQPINSKCQAGRFGEVHRKSNWPLLLHAKSISKEST